MKIFMQILAPIIIIYVEQAGNICNKYYIVA